MNYVIKIFLLLTFFFSTQLPLAAKVSGEAESIQQATSMAMSLPKMGVLKKRASGAVYLDVSNEYITALSTALDIPGKWRLPSTAVDAIGAHITVFQPQEDQHPTEIGQTFSFDVKEVKSIIVQTSGSLIKQWIVTVDAPALDDLRQQYARSNFLEGFYILIGQQVPCGPATAAHIDVLSPLNFSNSATLPCATQGDFTTYESDQLLKTAAKVDTVGKLCIQNNGFVYLDVSNDYIQTLMPEIPLKAPFMPLDTAGKAMGAHISVFYEDEMLKNNIWYLAEVGQWFTFEVKELRYIERMTAKGKKRLWFLAVDAPALQRLRKQYGLKPKLNGHDFHISIGNELIDATPIEINKELFEQDVIPAAA